jgi:CelD/BcsL family acetyltransferase involved in cellulose biosynthesis
VNAGRHRERPVLLPSEEPTIRWHDRIEPLAGEWDQLVDHTARMPWVRPGWVAAWWQAFGRGRLEVLVAWRADRLAGVLPLQRRPGRLDSTTNPHSPGFCLLAEDDVVRRALADALMRRRVRRVTLCCLPPAGAGLVEGREAARAAGRLLGSRTMLRSPYVPIEDDWATYEHVLGARKLRGLRRRRRRLERLGNLSVDVHDGRERLDQLLAEGWRVEASGWKGRRGTAVASHADTRRFYRAVARWAAGCGWLRLAFLRLDGHPIAFDFCIEEGGVHYLLKTGYDEAWREYGPGMLLRHHMLARAFALRLDRYEFLGADDPWKAEWTDKAHEFTALRAYARSLPGLVDWAAWAYGRPAVKRLLGGRAR